MRSAVARGNDRARPGLSRPGRCSGVGPRRPRVLHRLTDEHGWQSSPWPASSCAEPALPPSRADRRPTPRACSGCSCRSARRRSSTCSGIGAARSTSPPSGPRGGLAYRSTTTTGSPSSVSARATALPRRAAGHSSVTRSDHGASSRVIEPQFDVSHESAAPIHRTRDPQRVAPGVAPNEVRLPRGSRKPAWLSDGEGRNRTADTTIFSRVLYQLSYLAAAAKASARVRSADAGVGRCDLAVGGRSRPRGCSPASWRGQRRAVRPGARRRSPTARPSLAADRDHRLADETTARLRPSRSRPRTCVHSEICIGRLLAGTIPITVPPAARGAPPPPSPRQPTTDDHGAGSASRAPTSIRESEARHRACGLPITATGSARFTPPALVAARRRSG